MQPHQDDPKVRVPELDDESVDFDILWEGNVAETATTPTESKGPGYSQRETTQED